MKAIPDAYLSSQEEGIFGGFLEQLAVFVCSRVYGGRKSSAEGIDLEFEKDGIYYLVSIKSGPNWGNSRQIARMKDDFRRAKRIRGAATKAMGTVAVNGCCYGKDGSPDKGDYFKFCGQRFWEFISGDENLYTDIIVPIGHKAKEKNEQFQVEYAKVINKFTLEFSTEYCDPDGSIHLGQSRPIQLREESKIGIYPPSYPRDWSRAPAATSYQPQRTMDVKSFWHG